MQYLKPCGTESGYIMNLTEVKRKQYPRIFGLYDHPYANSRGEVLEHRIKAEFVLNKPLHPKHPVHHHYNKDGSITLVICENKIYHQLLENRTLALNACGHANWVKCHYCKEYGSPDRCDITITKRGNIYHKICHNRYYKKKRRDTL